MENYVNEQATAEGEVRWEAEMLEGALAFLLGIFKITVNHNETCVSDEGE